MSLKTGKRAQSFIRKKMNGESKSTHHPLDAMQTAHLSGCMDGCHAVLGLALKIAICLVDQVL